ncbi:heparin lyase I family protein [Tolypothrix sp. FACHB-123]|uniref:polysaccharide lyase n=1 Tax=Tolypothrix sp. FACHB-123 TaxID=2692868 RepID=UPI001687C85A|nr:heparin lyase I family protein [Tolypothrix sp. FACHB-123]MBD2357072.1 heparin lyase I family protein [Tolypothrix sp. FACHB-123]
MQKFISWRILEKLCCNLLVINCLGLILSSCNSPSSNNAIASDAVKVAAAENNAIASGQFTNNNWMQLWGVRKAGQWGLNNTAVIKDPSGRFEKILRVRYPAGSASPAVSRKNHLPLGGAQFYADLGITPKNALRLSYYLRFSENFDFVKGGKLPGLFGGVGNSGGDIPNGSDGFSTRFMWRRNGAGEVYAYLPTSTKDGTSIGRGNWQFQKGKWHHLEQFIVLNQPNKNNGQVQVWLDGKQVLNQKNLTFRTTNKLKIEGIFFSTFFGGSDFSWATPKDVHIDFANFSLSEVNQF